MNLICQCSLRWTNICLFKPQNRIIVLHLKLQRSRATTKCYPILKIFCTKFYFYNWHRLNGCQPHFYDFYFFTVLYGPLYCGWYLLNESCGLDLLNERSGRDLHSQPFLLAQASFSRKSTRSRVADYRWPCIIKHITVHAC